MSSARPSESVLLVPVHLDALFLPEAREFVGPAADFSRLPHVYGRQDINADVPWLGESIANRPFGDRPLKLERGLHLHWLLPDALCRASTRGRGAQRSLSFAAVPDRWLITKRWNSERGMQLSSWVIESNYLHPDATAPEAVSAGVPSTQAPIVFPYPARLAIKAERRPYRFMGRVLPLAEWQKQAARRQGESPQARNAEASYLAEPLTALGYGLPTFSTFYPNCHSIFGFHDADIRERPSADVRYSVLGWYDHWEQDHLLSMLAKSERPLAEVLVGLAWDVEGEYPQDGLPRILCQAQVTFAGTPPPEETEPNARSVEMSFGNTIAEALSAHLAGTIGGDTALEVEEQLEAVLLASRLDAVETDIGAKFREARHERSFTVFAPGFLWTLEPAGDCSQSAQNSHDSPREQAAWPDGSAELLEALNALQRQYNANWTEIRQRRTQLASDWHRFMLCAHPPLRSSADYPSADRVRRHIENKGLPALETLLAVTGELEFLTPSQASDSENDLRASAASKPNSLTQQIVAAAAALRAVLVPVPRATPTEARVPFARLMPRFFLRRVVAPRFYRPTEPVLLLSGKGIEPRTGHPHSRPAAGAALRCAWAKLGAELPTRIAALEAELSMRSAWASTDAANPAWHPLLMEWEVELRPLAYAAQDNTLDRNYDPHAITRNFVLRAGQTDLSPRSQSPALARRARVYSGTSLFTRDAVAPYIQALERELSRNQERDAVLKLDPVTHERINQALAWLKENPTLAQSLSGFNDALLMSRQTLQLPIADPLGFANERKTAVRLRAALGEGVHIAPQPAHSFSPLRSGQLHLARLRLVDTFGQTRHVDCASSTCRSASTLPRSKQACLMLPPRIVQAARLQFRWLDAERPTRETSAHPETTPIAGWFVANHVDRNLFVFAADGEALGYLESQGTLVRWHSAPGRPVPVVDLEAQIESPILRRMLLFFLASKGDFLDTFLADLEAADARIEPSATPTSYWMGRPLALVRASLQLQLEQPPVTDQGWHALDSDLDGGSPRTDRFTHIRFPLRLGESDQLADGLAVYFEEDARGTYDGYIIPNYSAAGEAAAKCDFLYLTLAAPPLRVTLLIDPQRAVHAATGILPTKSINVPAHHYAAALRSLELSFLSAPLLVGAGGQEAELALPLPNSAEQHWDFVEKRGARFQPPRALSAASKLYTPFSSATVIREGWLRLTFPAPPQEQHDD